jgi:diguanylate cyclase (GGDEF)-like protein/PAS domain S-box-containing protein
MRLLKSLLEHISDAVVVTNLNAEIQYVNPAFSAITGYSAREVFGKKPNCLKSGRHTREFYQEMWRTLSSTGTWQGQIWNRRKDGETYPTWLSVTTLSNPQGKALSYIGIASDMPQRQPDPGLARYQAANFDPLTGLPNRFLFDDKLALARAAANRHNQGVALFSLELEGFRPVQELLGLPAGDRLLQEVAERLRKRVREIDAVSRLQADRFVLAITEVKDVADIAQLAHTIVRWLEMPFPIAGHTVSVSPALGIALYPDDHTDGQALIRLAGEAMQRARAAGKGRFCFYNQGVRY